MAHVFRKYAGYNPNEVKCWSPSTVIDTSSFDVENIVFKRGASKAGTSIPSPLARLELFDTAFNIVSDDRNNLSGQTIYHQLVSDCLDLMQFLFSVDNSEIGYGKKVWFKEWKINENVSKLKSKGETHSHSILAKSLEQIFFDSSSRFFGTESIFLIFYENKLIGGTSPLTLFYTSPNWARLIEDGEIINIPKSKDGDTYFDDEYRSLLERDVVFVEYLYKLMLQNRSSFNKCEGLRKYINKTIDNPKFSEWKHKFQEYNVAQSTQNTEDDNYSANSLMDVEYDKTLTNIENKYLVINGIHFFHQKKGEERENIKQVSDFVIRATETKYRVQKDLEGIEHVIDPPLVIVDGMNISGDYMERNSPWDQNTKIKDFYHRAIPLYERRLPQGNSLTVTYPFITTDDFLEDFLVEMPYKINNSKFFTGYAGDFKYLLPIKKEYFNFFNYSDLKNNLKVQVDEGQVKVSLKIPIRNKKGVSEIIFSKTYNKSSGNIIDCRAGIGVCPFYKINGSDEGLKSLIDYTVLLAEKNEKISLNSLEFYSFDNFISDGLGLIHTEINRSSQSDVDNYNSNTTSKFFKIKEAFDLMEIRYNDPNGKICTGLIIPVFENKTYNKDNLIKAFTFAIDFGTSNTHVSFMENNEPLPRPFEIDESDQQMVLLNAPVDNKDLGVKYQNYGQFPGFDLTLKREFIPPIIKSKGHSTISYPFKTATCEIAAFNNIDKGNVHLFSHINIGYFIDQEDKKADGTISNNILYTTNIKWLLENNNDDANKSRVKFFLKQLLMQIKAKTILSSGNPNTLKIVWSVPLSMERGNRSTLKNILKEAFREVFGSSGAKLLEPIPESVAPYFYLTRSDAGIQDTANAINIDIGGGTTDVMMFMESAGNREDKYLTTSFRFAGGDIWGSGYKNKLKDNGFIKNYLNYQKVNNINPDENKYFNKVKDDGNLSSDDLISLLFRYDSKFKFNDSITIGNPDLSIILYLHFSAIIYHINQIIELKNYPLPRYLSFTGKGSQYIKLICGGDESELEEFTKLLFKSYSTQKLQSSFKIHLNDNPKEITANGAVLYSNAPDDEKSKYDGDFEFVHPGFDTQKDTELVNKITDTENADFYISEVLAIDSPLNIAVLNNLNTFLEKTLGNKQIIDFLSDFKIKNVKTYHEALKWNGDIFTGEGFIYDSYKKVLKDLEKQDKDKELPESLFFYALKDALYRLSKSIVEPKKI